MTLYKTSVAIPATPLKTLQVC